MSVLWTDRIRKKNILLKYITQVSWLLLTLQKHSLSPSWIKTSGREGIQKNKVVLVEAHSRGWSQIFTTRGSRFPAIKSRAWTHAICQFGNEFWAWFLIAVSWGGPEKPGNPVVSFHFSKRLLPTSASFFQPDEVISVKHQRKNMSWKASRWGDFDHGTYQDHSYDSYAAYERFVCLSSWRDLKVSLLFNLKRKAGETNFRINWRT